jgi:hypothetical protein
MNNIAANGARAPILRYTRILWWVAVVLLLAGIGLIATGIVLTGAGKLVSADGYLLPNYHAALCFLVGSPVLWLGCAGIATVLRRGWAVLAGVVTVGASFVVPWSLHAIGVTWWTYYSPIPAVATLVAGCVLLGVAATRIAFFWGSQLFTAVSRRWPLRILRAYLRAVVIGFALGLLVYLWLGRLYQPPPAIAFSSSVIADFEWDSAHGVTVFHLRGPATSNGVWARAREFLVGVQIKPQLDWFMRLGPTRQATGFAEVHVVKVVPFALPSAWGSGGLCVGTGKCA